LRIDIAQTAGKIDLSLDLKQQSKNGSDHFGSRWSLDPDAGNRPPTYRPRTARR
jgi:hypothetical protein